MSHIIIFTFVFCVLLSPACKNPKNVKPTNDKTTQSANFMTESKDESNAPILIPGQSIGMIRIGMTKLEIELQGINLKPHPRSQFGNVLSIFGPYQIVFEKDRVASIALNLKDSRRGIAIADQALPPTASLEDIAKALPDCRQVEAYEGGTVVSCGCGTTLVKRGAGDGAIEIQVLAPDFAHFPTPHGPAASG